LNLTLFDLDGTLIPFDSDHAFGEFMARVGWVDAAAFRTRNDAFYGDYLAGTLDLAAYLEFATSPWRRRPDAESMRSRFVAEVVQPQLHPRALALVDQHRAAGDLVAIVTATNEFVTAPIAAAFGVEHLIAVKLEHDASGQPTGRMLGVASFREGKVTRVHEWLGELGQRWEAFERITFYSDSTNDLPLLERVHQPVATNPGAALEQIARERGWRILHLFE
jgi:HAD superfamily hydrolase (TIGR01490 family)